MPYVRTKTGDDVEVPSLGLVVPADESAEITDEQAAAIGDHPLLVVTKTERPPIDAPPGPPAPPSDPSPSDSAPAPDAPAAS